jgi:hypothetical protein
VGLSVVTVCMNRRDHLLATAPRVAQWPFHAEHLIVDWSSSEPLRRGDLPDDPRLRLLRVEGERRWTLCRAYNFAIARSRGDRILKLDADCWPLQAFDPEAELLRVPVAARLAEVSEGVPKTRLCAFGSGQEGQKGQFLIERALYEAVGGFNEFLIGYGFDDKDLRARLRLRLGNDHAAIPLAWLGVIPHSDQERAGFARPEGDQGLGASLGLATMRASRQGNRLLAAHCPWGSRSAASAYEEEAPGRWRVRSGSVPQPPASVAAEIDHDRRMTFWSCFLGIPQVFLEVLPFPLFPPARQGRWDVRWWHRLYWRTGRRLVQLPVCLLIFAREGRQWLLGFRQRKGARP